MLIRMRDCLLLHSDWVPSWLVTCMLVRDVQCRRPLGKEFLMELNVDKINGVAEFLFTWEGGRTLRP